MQFSKGEQDRLQMIILQSQEKEWVDVYQLIPEYEQRLNDNRQRAVFGDTIIGDKQTSRKDKNGTAMLIQIARKVLQ
jgi:hypothetical protein